MSKVASSPTARLLQSSRLFSLPRPLPRPVETASKFSDTATLPYPTHQAITTPAAALARGDWGLKRPLPGKKTRNTSTPIVRIHAQDTYEHVTEFMSAADHALTAAKWLEMGVPMMRPTRSVDGKAREISVYESDIDNTAPAPIMEAGRASAQTRWKYDGPFIAGMQEGEFQRFLVEIAVKRSKEWKEFLSRRLLQRRIDTARKDGRDLGQPLAARGAALRPQYEPTEDDIIVEEKRLRDDHADDKLSSELTALIQEFLDLPPILNENNDANNPALDERFSKMINNLATVEERAAPSTHPGAGLSHLRTAAILDNHPLYGPQAHRSPVRARVVRPRLGHAGNSVERNAKLGVAGVVADDRSTETIRRSSGPKYQEMTRDRVENLVKQLDPDAEGGNKIWVHPKTAQIDEKGRIKLAVALGEDEAIAVRTGDVSAILAVKTGQMQSRTPNAPLQRPSEPLAPPGTRENANYGFSLPDTRTRQNLSGFDDVLPQGRQAGRLDDDGPFGDLAEMVKRRIDIRR